MTRGQVRFLFAIVAIAAIVLIAVWIRDRYASAISEAERHEGPPAAKADRQAPAQPREAPPRPSGTDESDSALAAPAPASRPGPLAATAPQATAADRSRAAVLLAKGLELAAGGDLLAARADLADALNSQALPHEQAAAARGKLTELADKTIFSRQVIEGDPCTGWYAVKPGDVLVRVERDLKLHVPTQLLLRVNGVADATKIQAGQRLKVVRGPFHALVAKSRFTMDAYLEEPGTKRLIFVRRFRVGTGKDGSTPAGRWRVALGGKIVRAPWTPPSSVDMPRRTIRWGEEGYPLGAHGYWISLEGIENTPYTTADGYGIHGTNDPASIGRASSMGCIRLSDEDITMLFALLYEHWSTVTVLP